MSDSGCGHWEVQSQIARRLAMVSSRRRWVAAGGTVLLGNVSADC